MPRRAASQRAATPRRYGADFRRALVGAAVLLAAITGTFALQQHTQEPVYHVTWMAGEPLVHVFRGDLVVDEAPQPHPLTIDTPPALVSSMHVLLTWEEPLSDELRLSVTASNGTVNRHENQGGVLSVTPFPGRPGPAGSLFYAQDDDDARMKAWRELTDKERGFAQGEWRFDVELSAAPRWLADGVPHPLESGSNRYRLEVSILVWEPDVRQQ